jgi:hypothetical protein
MELYCTKRGDAAGVLQGCVRQAQGRRAAAVPLVVSSSEVCSHVRSAH